MVEQVREAAKRETEMLRVTTLLSEMIASVEQTKVQLHSVNELHETTVKELAELKTAAGWCVQGGALFHLRPRWIYLQGLHLRMHQVDSLLAHFSPHTLTLSASP